MKEKTLIQQFFILTIMIMTFAVAFFWKKTAKNNTLTVGIFYGSNWDVPGTQYHKIVDAAIEKFREKYPNIEVKYVEGIPEEDYSEWLSESITRGKAPDVYFVKKEDLPILAKIGALKKLESNLMIDSHFNPNVFYQSAYEMGNVLNWQYALPFECNAKLMFVNKTLLRQAGVKVPERDWDWETFYRICSQVTKDKDQDGKIDQFGFYNYSLEDAMIANNVQLLTKNQVSKSIFKANEMRVQPNLLDVRLSETLQYMRKLQEIYHNYMVTSEEFDLGNVAFRPLTLAEYRTYMPYPWRIKKYSSFEWTCVSMPAGNSGYNDAQLNTLMVGMNAKTENSKYAWEFMKFLTTDEEIQSLIYEYSSGASPVKNVTKSKKTLELLNEDTPGNSNIDMSLLDRALENGVAFQENAAGYEDVLLEIENQLNQYLVSGDDLSLDLYNLNEEIRKLLQ